MEAENNVKDNDQKELIKLLTEIDKKLDIMIARLNEEDDDDDEELSFTDDEADEEPEPPMSQKRVWNTPYFQKWKPHPGTCQRVKPYHPYQR